MPGLLTLPSNKAINVIGKDQAARVKNTASSGTAYFGGDSVTSSSNDYSLAAGESRIVNGPRWGIGSAELLLLLEDLPVGVGQTPGQTNTRFYMHGYKDTSTGTDTTVTTNRAYVGALNITSRVTLTGAAFLIGGTGGTHKAVVALWDSTGKLLASSLSAGTTVGTANTYQALNFITPVEILTPGRYLGGVIYSGTTPTLRTAIVDGAVGGTINSASDFSAVPIDITPPTSTGATDVSPQGYYVF